MKHLTSALLVSIFFMTSQSHAAPNKPLLTKSATQEENCDQPETTPSKTVSTPAPASNSSFLSRKPAQGSLLSSTKNSTLNCVETPTEKSAEEQAKTLFGPAKA